MRFAPCQRLSIFGGRLFRYPDQMSEAPAAANACKDRREAIESLKEKSNPLRVDPSIPLAKKCELRLG
jgi:hypothetical protein